MTEDVDGYTSAAGSFDAETKSQTTTLTVSGDQSTSDATYDCYVESVEHGKTAETTAVHLKVFSKYISPSSPVEILCPGGNKRFKLVTYVVTDIIHGKGIL